MKKIFTLLFLCVYFCNIYAYDIEYNGLYYNELSFIGKKVAVTSSPEGKKYSGEITIPSTIEITGMVFNVTEIESNAFANCSGLTRVSIGANVEKINEGAFSNCSSLMVVSIEDGEKELYMASQIDYTGENGYYVGLGTFANCPLDSVYIGRDLDYLLTQQGGCTPFYNLVNLRAVKFGDKVNTINSGLLFYSHLESVDLGNNVRLIKDGAFSSAYINEIILPESLDSIGYQVFQFCPNLEKVISLRKIPHVISKGAFDSGGYVYSKPLKKCTLYVPTGSLYKKTEGWDVFPKYEVISATNIVPDVDKITLSPADSYSIVLKTVPIYADLDNIEWTSSCEDIAIVDENGTVTIVGPGDVIITAVIKGSSVSTSISIHVDPILATNLKFPIETITLGIAEQYQINPILLPENVSQKELTWYSSNEKAVVVSSTGLITRIGPGECKVIAMTKDGSNLIASCIVTESTTGISGTYINESLKVSYGINGIKNLFSSNGIIIMKNSNGATKKYFKNNDIKSDK